MEIDFNQILLQILNFLIVLFVLKKFLYKPVLKILDERAEKINEGLNAAEKSLKAQTQIEEQKKEEIVSAQREAAKILDEARKEAENLKSDILNGAKEDASKVIEKERTVLEVRLKEQENKIKDNIGNLVAAATKSVLKEALTDDAQRQIINNQIKSLRKIKVN